MLSACSYVCADKFTACVQNVRLPNACMHRNVSCVHVRHSARPSQSPSEFQNSAAQRWFFFYRDGGENKRCLLPRRAVDVEVIAVIRQISGNEFVFQQDSAPAFSPRQTLSSYIERRAGLYFTRTVATEQSSS